MTRVFCFLCLSLFLSAFSMAEESPDSAKLFIEKSKELKLSEDPQWRHLIHYRRNPIGLMKSQLVGESFFLSPDGKTDAQSELEADLAAFHQASTAKPDDAPYCKFPARRKWLQKKLAIPDSFFAKGDCPLYSTYRERMKFKSLSVVFSSYYPNSPSSTYGHTFFKINREADDGIRNEILDWGIGYAAEVDANGALDYLSKGLFGGFKGTYSSVPYYQKIREYNDYEARDLWSYELNLTPEEIDFLLDHIWELGDSHFRYYFFTQNCGYHLLTVLEAAIPRLQLTERLPLWAIPADALKEITNTPGLINKVSSRPSIYGKLKSDFSYLNDDQKDYLEDLLETNDLQKFSQEENLPAESKAKVLDVYLENFDFLNAEKIARQESATQNRRNEILALRAQLPTISENPMAPAESTRPDISHPSARLQVNRVSEDVKGISNGRTQLELRLALHDSLDPQKGYPKYSSVSMGRLQLERNELKNRTEISQFQVLGLESFIPIEKFRVKGSWGVDLGINRTYEPSCLDCKLTEFKFGYGASYEFRPQVLAFAMLYNRLQFGQDLPYGFGDIFEPQIGFLGYAGTWAFRFQVSPKQQIYQSRKSWVAQSLEIRKNFDSDLFLRAVSSQQDASNSYELGMGYFF